MFASATFRWTFVTWQFFSFVATASAVLTLLALILGLVCRLNFGKGLLRYRKLGFRLSHMSANWHLVHAHELPDEKTPDPYLPSQSTSDPEKVEFPSATQTIPTFSVAFGSGDELPLPSQMFTGRHLGPRFFQESALPFESPLDDSDDMSSSTHSHGSLQKPPPSVHSRQNSEESEITLSILGHGSKRWQIE